jgi:hypothetical protein
MREAGRDGTVCGEKTTSEEGKGLHTFEMGLSVIRSLAFSISIFLLGSGALFYSQTIKT